MHLHPQHATDCIQGHVWGSHHIPCCSYVSLATPCFEELCPHVQCILLGVLARFELGSNVLDQFPMIGTHLLRNLHNQMFFPGCTKYSCNVAFAFGPGDLDVLDEVTFWVLTNMLSTKMREALQHQPHNVETCETNTCTTVSSLAGRTAGAPSSDPCSSSDSSGSSIGLAWAGFFRTAFFSFWLETFQSMECYIWHL